MEGKKSKYGSGFKANFGSGLMVHGERLNSMEYNKKTYSKPYTKKVATAKVEYKPKRGKLSKLMTEEEKQNAGIHELSYDFGCRITRLFQYLTEDADYKEFVQSKQIYRSGTSIGANVRENRRNSGTGSCFMKNRSF